MEPVDPAWRWIRRRFDPSPIVMRAVYRAFFVYGACRIVAWSVWARFLNPRRGVEVIDLSIGGPYWIDAASFPAESWPVCARTTVVGLVGVSAAIAVLWWVIGRRLWRRAV